MGELTARVIEGINNSKESKDFANWIWMAGELIRKTSAPGFHSGFEEIDREEVSDDERRQLREAVLNALRRSEDPRYLGPLLSALSGTFDPDLIPLWVEYLSKFLEMLKASNAVVHTILIALDEIGEYERAIGPSGRSIADIDRNVDDAQKYLLRHGVKIPY